jgi:hypothetical protein
VWPWVFLLLDGLRLRRRQAQRERTLSDGARRTPIKDQQAEATLFQRRAVLSYVLMLLVFGVLLARFCELMILRHSEYARALGAQPGQAAADRAPRAG